ncbi:MAG: QueT transporter family protein [Clostridia bacterium]
MQNFSSRTRKMCRAGLIAALYAVLTYVTFPFSFGPIQVRIAESLTLLPLFFFESVPALFVGCLLSNILSAYGIFDIIFGSLTSLVAGLLTYWTGKLIRNHFLRVAVGGIFPVLLNAFVIPLVMLASDSSVAYWSTVLSIFCTQAVWVYALGGVLYYGVNKLRKKNFSAFL